MCNLLYWTSERLDVLSDNICGGEDEWIKVSWDFFLVSYFQVVLTCIWQCYKSIHPVKAFVENNLLKLPLKFDK